MLEGELLAPIYETLPKSFSRALAWSGNAKWMAIGTFKGAIHLYESFAIPIPTSPRDGTKDGPTPTRTLQGLKGWIRSVHFFRGGLAAVDEYGLAARWTLDSETPDSVWQANEGRSNTIQMALDGSWAVTGGLDGIALWSLPEGRRIARFGTQHMGVACLHLEPRQTWLAATFLDGSVAVFDLPTGRERWRVQPSTEVASAVAVHPSGEWLVSAGWDDSVIAWDANHGTEKVRIKAKAASLAWSHDGKRLALGHASGVDIVSDTLGALEGPEYHIDYGWDEECT
jgi:WD40 repeat protein